MQQVIFQPYELIFLTTPQTELQKKDVAFLIQPASAAPLWDVLRWQRENFEIELACTLCGSSYLHAAHAPAARVDVWHQRGGIEWNTLDIVCESCLGGRGLLYMIEMYLSQCAEVTLVRRNILTGEGVQMH